jgi:Yip1 domain
MILSERVKNIILQPAQEWKVIEKEPTTTSELYTSYIIILAAIGPVASIIGLTLFGVSTPLAGAYRLPIGSVIGHAVVSYALALAGVYVFGLVINALAPTFLGTKNEIQALKVAAYSSTASWLAGIFMVVPALSFLQILGLYSLYLLYLGLPLLMKAPEEKALVYTVVVIVVGMVIMVLIGAVSGLLLSYPGPAIR